jgi:hypothetical protein
MRSPSPTERAVDSPAVFHRQPGETVVLRYLNRGRPVGALPTRLVSEDGPVLWLPGGTSVARPGIGGRRVREVPLEARYTLPWEQLDGSWTGDGILIVGRPGRAHSIWLFWEGERFAGWYVNLEAPWRPSSLGFDTEDHTLDVWIESDGSWEWKDEHELAAAVECGFFDAKQAVSIRAEGERVLAEWPLPTGWEEWSPNPSWPVPSLPEGWAG